MKQALTIAGSDSGGGAGVQADIKTMHAHGVFGASVITAITAQNTVAVTESYVLPAGIIKAQLDAVLDDLDIAAIKTGMLASREIIQTVAGALRERNVGNLVVDPVMVSTGGDPLLETGAIDAMVDGLFGQALLVTPNIDEAQQLSGIRIASPGDVETAARRIHKLGCSHVLIKGGHAEFSRATDVLFDGEAFHRFSGTYTPTRNLHGTGCTLSAAITARLALGEPLLVAIDHAKRYVTRAIAASLDIGRGHGPTNHFYFLSPDDYDR